MFVNNWKLKLNKKDWQSRAGPIEGDILTFLAENGSFSIIVSLKCEMHFKDNERHCQNSTR